MVAGVHAGRISAVLVVIVEDPLVGLRRDAAEFKKWERLFSPSRIPLFNLCDHAGNDPQQQIDILRPGQAVIAIWHEGQGHVIGRKMLDKAKRQ